MQKKIIALALATAFAAPAFADTANVTVYGRVHTSLDSNSGNAGTSITGTKNGLNLTSNASRLGFKGTEELGDGIKAVYQYETEILAQGGTSLLGSQRDTYVGAAGGFGTVIAGRLPLANQYVGDANFFADKVGDAGNLTAGGLGGLGLLAVPSRVSRAIAYVSPSLGGVTLTAGYVPNTPQALAGTTASQSNASKESSFTLRAAYENAGIFVAANYLSLGVAGISLAATPGVGVPSATAGTTAAPVNAQAGAKVTIFSLAGGYDFGVAKVRAQLVNTDANQQAAWSVGAGSGAKQSVAAVGGQFNLGESDAIKAQVARASDAKLNGVTAANTSATLLAVGYDRTVSKRTTVYAAYAKANNGTASQFSVTNYAHGGVGTPGAGKSPSSLSFGVIHNF